MCCLINWGSWPSIFNGFLTVKRLINSTYVNTAVAAFFFLAFIISEYSFGWENFTFFTVDSTCTCTMTMHHVLMEKSILMRQYCLYPADFSLIYSDQYRFGERWDASQNTFIRPFQKHQRCYLEAGKTPRRLCGKVEIILVV